MRHRAQLFGAIFISVGSVFFVSRLLKSSHHGCHGHSQQAQAPAVLAPIPLPTAPPVAPPQVSDEYGTALKRAATAGDVTEVRRLLDSHTDVHISEYENDAPLLLADAHPDVVKLLLDAGVNEPDLSTACIAGAPNAVSRILAKGESANPTNGTTPLYDAIETTIPTPEIKYAIVEKLLAAGASPSSVDQQPDPLTAAVISCENDGSDHCLKLIKLLQSKGAKTDGQTLGVALTADPAVLDYLLSHPLQPGATAIALSNGSVIEPSIVKKVAARGVVWNFRDGDPSVAAPLIDAIDMYDFDMVKAMLDAGAPADLHLKDGRCPLAETLDSYFVNNATDAARVVELLLAHGANPNRRFPDGRSPLFAAAETGDTRIVNALLNAGARPNDKVLDETPLDAAERSGHTAVARVLDAHGGKRSARPDE